METLLETTDERPERLKAVRARLDEWGVDAILITNGANQRWLSGFTGSAGQLLVTKEEAWLATDFRYWSQAEEQATGFKLFKHRRTDQATADFIALAGPEPRIGFEASHVSVKEADGLKRLPGTTWLALTESLEALRQVKSVAEVQAIRAAAKITDSAMLQVSEIARPGMTERSLAWELEKTVRELGADGMAFDIIVASGPNSALPHYRPGSRRLQEGDALVVDLGARLNGYHSDLTRSFFLGKEPDEAYWEVFELVLAAQQRALQVLKAGTGCREVQAVARDVINAGGHGEHFGHGLGHGVGLDIHEAPWLSARASTDTLIPAGAIVTVEPGIYVPGWGGVRIEDLIVVTEAGFDSLSQCPRNPVIPVRD